MVKFHHFRDFIAVAEARSIRGAARTLDMAQPALSRSLRELEKEAGVPLLVRHATGVQLTLAGERLLVRARNAMQEVRRGMEEMEHWGKDIGGEVYIAMSSPPILALLPAVYRTFRRLYRKVHLHLMEATFPTAEPLLRDGRLDFYIGGLAEAAVHRSFQCELLFKNRRTVFARHGHPLAGARSLKDLQNADWLYGGLRQQAKEDLDELFHRHGLEAPMQMTRVDSHMGMLMLMLNTDAVALVPRQWGEASVVNELVRPLALDEDFDAPDVVMIKRAGIPLTPSAEKLADLFVREANLLYRQGDSRPEPRRRTNSSS